MASGLAAGPPLTTPCNRTPTGQASLQTNMPETCFDARLQSDRHLGAAMNIVGVSPAPAQPSLVPRHHLKSTEFLLHQTSKFQGR